tara:strand:+ start:293 stop:676 length:384 start_codon:yes stop_codon:yes gene_type:complete
MAFGTLKADTLTHSTAGSLATNYVVKGTAKVWATVNAGSEKDSFGVSSFDDNGTGNHDINFTNAFDNALYSCLLTASDNPGTANDYIAVTVSGSVAAGSFRYYTYRASSNTQTDLPYVSSAFHGDLA